MKSFLFLLFALASCVETWGTEVDPSLNKMLEIKMTREEVVNYYHMLGELNPKVNEGELLRKLEEVYGVRADYRLSEVFLSVDAHALDEPIEYPYQPADIRRSLPVPHGAFSNEEVCRYFGIVTKRKEIAAYIEWMSQPEKERFKTQPKPVDDLYAALKQKYGAQPWYRADEILDVEKKGGKNKGDVKPTVPLPRRVSEWNAVWRGWQTLKIRKDWADVINSEDLSQTDTGKKTIDDLEGAKFSYSHDAQAKEYNGSTTADTWSAVGSAILPITWNGNAETARFVTFMVAPSISINRVSTSGNPTNNEVDHLDYRVGAYGKWLGFREGLTAVQLRGAFVYGTDTGHRASMPAGELDFEPQFAWHTASARDVYENWRQNWWGIGYRNVLVPRIPQKEDFSDNSLLDWQLRTWAHFEGGDLQRNGAKWDTVDGNFLRLGPVVQTRVNFPEFLQGFSITGQYSYMEPLQGRTDRNSLWKVGGAFTLYENKASHQKLSLTADYTKGGLLLSKQPVDVLNVGIGVIF